MVRFLDHWVLHRTLPTIQDYESLTTLQLNGMLTNKMNELIKDYNEFVEVLLKEFTAFDEETEKELKCFKNCIIEITSNFIQTLETKMILQDKKIEDHFTTINVEIDAIKTNIETLQSEIDELKTT